MAKKKVIKKVHKEHLTPGSLDDQLEKTEIGHFFRGHRILVPSLIAVILASVIGGSLYLDHRNKTRDLISAKIYEFKMGPLQNFKEKKSSAEEFTSQLQTLQSQAQGNANYVAIVLEAVSELKAQKNYNQALGALNYISQQHEKNDYLNFFIKSNMAALNEDLGSFDQAIAILEKLTHAETKFLEAKTYLDLGRVYAKKGDKLNAKAKFEYVVENFPNDEMAKLAKIYLTQVGDQK